MPFNSVMMCEVADLIRNTITHGQLHSSSAGDDGTENLTTAPRVAITWSAATGLGSFGLNIYAAFSGGVPTGLVYSMTLWDAASGGVCRGEFPMSPTGDRKFSNNGNYTVTVLDLMGLSRTVIGEGS